MKIAMDLLDRYPRISGAVFGIFLHPIFSALLLTR